MFYLVGIDHESKLHMILKSLNRVELEKIFKVESSYIGNFPKSWSAVKIMEDVTDEHTTRNSHV